MNDKRSENRRLTFLSIYEYGDDGIGSPGLLMNLTSRGGTILVRESERAVPDHFYMIIHPPNKASSCKRITLKAKKIWESIGTIPLYHIVGCEFEALSDENDRLINCLLPD